MLKDALEKLVHQQQTDSDTRSVRSGDDNGGGHYNVLSFFAREFQRFNDSQGAGSSAQSGSTPSSKVDAPPTKRRRLDEEFAYQPKPASIIASMSDDDELNLLLKAYFAHVHPWIPMLHEARLRRRLATDNERQKLGVVIRAMVLVAARYIQDDQAARRLTISDDLVQQARDDIVATAMRQLSVENLQALIMMAFNDIGGGRAENAWPIVGALSRNVEYLQLAVESDETERHTLSQPFVSLSPPSGWTEAEERRRVFWNAFNLDRLCSVSMGWNTSLTSDDVNRRLPCDGIKWRKEDEVTTPYFGIWDKAAGRIGNPIAFLPSHYSGPLSSGDDEGQTPSDTGTSPGAPSAHIDMSTVGAFAYSIEATESLSRVTTYFLQQRVNMRDQKDLTRWLTRFKELDLRLVHWKMLLPHKWKVDTSQRSSRMDPNLTLAHITHNASMILLHQPIAFPLPEWPFKNRLPSSCSADTCEAAAAEIATITENYLKNAPPSVPVASQFAFCLYVASRACLLQWRYNPREPLASSFWSLIQSLDIMSRRWAGPHAVQLNFQNTNLAAKYSAKLKELYQACMRNSGFKVDVLGYIGEVSLAAPSSTASAAPEDQELDEDSDVSPGAEVIQARDGVTQDFPQVQQLPSNNFNLRSRHQSFANPQTALDLANDQRQMAVTPEIATKMNPMPPPSTYHRGSVPNADLGAISQLLLDQQFVDMDRIISYNDGMFGTEYEGGSW